MNPQRPSSKRELASSYTPDSNNNRENGPSPKRSKKYSTNDEATIDPKLVSHLVKMAAKDKRLITLLGKVGKGSLSPSEFEEFNRYCAVAHTSLESVAEPTNNPSSKGDFTSSSHKANAPGPERRISAKPSAQSDHPDRRVISATAAAAMPSLQTAKRYSPLYMSAEPESRAEKSTDSAQKNSPRGECSSDGFISSTQEAIDRCAELAAPKNCSDKTISSSRVQQSGQEGKTASDPLNGSRQTSFSHPAKFADPPQDLTKISDRTQKSTRVGESSLNQSSSPRQPSFNYSAKFTAPIQHSNTGESSDRVEMSTLKGKLASDQSTSPHQPPSNRTAKLKIANQRPGATKTSDVAKKGSTFGQGAKNKEIEQLEEPDDEEFFARFTKKKPTNQDLARYRQGEKLPLATRSETEQILDKLRMSGVEVEESESYERRILKDKFGLAGPSVDLMMRNKFGPSEPFLEKARGSGGQPKQSVSSTQIENFKGTIKKLQDKISQKREIISEKDESIEKLRGEVKKVKQLQIRSSGLEQDLKKANEDVTAAKAKIEKLKAQLAAAHGDLRNAQDKIVQQEALLDHPAPTQTDVETEAANLRDENAALRKTVAALRALNNPFPKHKFTHPNLFASPLVVLPKPPKASRSQVSAAPTREYGRSTRIIPESSSDEEESEEGSVYREGTSDVKSQRKPRKVKHVEREEASEEDQEEGKVTEEEAGITKNQRGMQALDEWLGMPANPKPIRVDGVLAYRDGTRVRIMSDVHAQSC